MIKHRGFIAVVIFIMALAMLVTIGCDETQYHKTAQAAASISTSLKGAQDFNASLYRTHELSKDETIAVAMAISDASLANDQFVAKLQTLKGIDTSNKAEVSAWIGELAASVDQLNRTGVLRIKNPQSQLKFSATIQAIEASIELIRISIK